MKKSTYLCTRNKERALSSAGLEHLPYKQRVGGSNPSAPTQAKRFPIRKPLFIFPRLNSLTPHLLNSSSPINMNKNKSFWTFFFVFRPNIIIFANKN